MPVVSDECDLGPAIELAALRRRFPSLPSISEISFRLEAALGITRTAILLTDSGILSPKSVCSQSLSQVDSGFGSPPFFVADDDYDDDVEDADNDDGNMSGIEPFETHDDFRGDILGDYSDPLTVDGKSHSRFCA